MKNNSMLNEFIELVSNSMESYSTCFFNVEEKERNSMILASFYSLSNNINKNCTIRKGEGLAGWVLKEKKTVTATYFDKRDATTLKYYNKNENIKSFMAVPLPDGSGVLCVDSKKSYVFTEEKEKILKQMASVLMSILNLEKELKEKNTAESLLSLSININEILVNNEKKDEYLNDFFYILLKRLNLYVIVFVIECEKIIITYDDDKKIFSKELHFNSLDNSSFVAWVLKNNKYLYLEKINNNEKSFIISRQEPFGNYNNFLGFPLFFNDKKGVLAFVKKSHEYFSIKEKKILDILSNIFYREYFSKK